jgi:Holliday junction resolvasome RuvABC endonuclease subunit
MMDKILYAGIDPGVYTTTLSILDSSCNLVVYLQVYNSEDEYPRIKKENRKKGQREYDPVPEQIAIDHREFMLAVLDTYNLSGVVAEKMDWSASNSDTQGYVHHNRGIIHAACIEKAVPFFMISPQQIKKAASGKGNAGKDEVVDAIFEKYGSFFPSHKYLKKNNHIADSIGAAIWLVADQLNYLDDDSGY